MEEQQQAFDTGYHAPVMWKECISALLGGDRYQACKDNPGTGTSSGVFLDGTLGGGGHASALLKNLQPGDIVVGCDVDSDALATASQRLSDYLGSKANELPLFLPVRSNFCELASVLSSLEHPVTNEPLNLVGSVDGILLDLGVSSYQIDTPERGFAFMKDGPLDMRMGRERGLTAADLCNELDQRELQRILKTYGDEPRARRIAQSIVERRPLTTTKDLVAAVSAVTPDFVKKSRRLGRTATLARVFQSIRIMVNQEDKVLNQALSEMCPALLRPGGRLAVLSYHSLEDRPTKRIIRDGTLYPTRQTNEKDMYGNFVGTPRPFRA
eukprot:CAMPEP_0198142880 /NCGR_PEP_ID=MMETSP1443-20131203/5564_1 /TAXON_ID=186043 /ORGANISM="Entomoneis sp., Strain CCMP2396" /LENGTH=325 /DNA_ID=CAMNT_0043805995 /DNA_START=135 /DNA_END=1109 /DNA_ORIENTATION=-